MNLATTWSERRVLVTGHTGFKGGWLSLWLQALGAKVAGYALPPPTRPSLFDVAKVGEGMLSVEGDVLDLPVLSALVRDFQPEVIFHLAAQPLVRHSYAEPVETFATNVMGTVHVLEAARQAGCVRALVNVTTDKCYENRESLTGYVESDRLGGHDPYSSSKACSELVASCYRQSFGHTVPATAIATARAGNVFGGGDWAQDRLLPDLLAALSQRRAAVLRYPNAIRPWQHVLDPLHGYLMVAEGLLTDPSRYARAWNFGPEPKSMVTSGQVADDLCALWGAGASWVAQTATSAPHETGILMLDSSQAQRELGWLPRLTLRDGLACTVDWYKAWQADASMREWSLGQVNHYMRPARSFSSGVPA